MGLFSSSGSGKRMPIFEGMDSVIGQKAKFKGELITGGSININGELEGKIKAEGEVVVSQGGKIVGEIHGGGVIIAGLVEGNITAKETLEIHKSGRVHGNLSGGKIVIDEGSSYHGKVKVNSELTEVEKPETAAYIPISIEENPQTESFQNI